MAEQLAEFAADLDYEDIPHSVIEEVKLHLLDSLGICAAATKLRTSIIIKKTAEQMWQGSESVSIPYCERTSVMSSAFQITGLIHSLDFDDTHPESLTHPSPPTFGTTLSLAIANGNSTEDFLKSSVIGFEAITRIGAGGFHKFHEQGFHPTAICGVFSCALAACSLFGASKDVMVNSLGISGNMSAGLAQTIREGSPVKILNPAHASVAGIMAARLAKEGYEGSKNIFEGEFGFYESYLGKGNYDAQRAVHDLGSVWETPKTAFKKYPCGFEEHPFMDAASMIRQELRPNLDEIEEVTYGDYSAAIQRASEPAAAKRNPKTPYEAKFSRYFCISSALLFDHPGVGVFSEEGIRDRDILELASRTRYVVDEVHKWVRVKTRRSVFEHRQDEMIPATRDYVIAKARNNLRLRYDQDTSDRISDAVLNLEAKGLGNLIELFKSS